MMFFATILNHVTLEKLMNKFPGVNMNLVCELLSYRQFALYIMSSYNIPYSDIST